MHIRSHKSTVSPRMDEVRKDHPAIFDVERVSGQIDSIEKNWVK